jgi:hypothetical protein
MGWIEVAVPLKWFEDCHLSPVLGWNLTVSMEAQLLGTRSLSGLEQSEDRETSCLKDGCEEKRYLPGNDCEPGERQIPDSWNITFYRRWVRFLQVTLVLSPCLPALKDSRDSRRPLLRFL